MRIKNKQTPIIIKRHCDIVLKKEFSKRPACADRQLNVQKKRESGFCIIKIAVPWRIQKKENSNQNVDIYGMNY